MEKVKLSVVGLCSRGYGILRDLVLNMDNAVVTAVCDLYEDRVIRAAECVEKAYGEGNRPFTSSDYKEVLDRDDVEAVLILSAWESHFRTGSARRRWRLPRFSGQRSRPFCAGCSGGSRHRCVDADA